MRKPLAFLAIGVIGVIGVLGPTWVYPQRSRAQDISYQRTPIGDRAVGMGGAYTGVAEDVSAVWYNPGGLAFQGTTSISGALSLSIFTSYHVEDGYGFSDESADLDDDGSTTIPFFVGGMTKLGPEEDPALRRHTIAGAAVSPVVLSRRFDAGVQPTAGTGETGAAVLRTQTRAKLQYFGPSYAYRLSDRLGIGMSAYLSLHTFDYEESESVGAFRDRQPDGSFMNAAAAARISGGKSFVASLLFRLGFAWEPNDEVRIGLMLQLPNLPIIRDGEISEFTTRVGPDGAGEFGGAQQETTPELRQPFEARLGVGYRPVPHWRLALDVSVYGPLQLRVFGETTPDPTTGVEPSPGRFFANEIAFTPIANFAIGAETIINDFIPFAFGVFSDFSPSRGVHEPTDVYTPDRMDNVGLTAVIGYRRSGYNLAIGGTLTLGWGAAYGTNPDPTASERYVPRAARSSALYLFITGYTGAAEQLAHDVEEYRMTDEERQARDDSDAEKARLEELRRHCEEQLQVQINAPPEEEAQDDDLEGDELEGDELEGDELRDEDPGDEDQSDEDQRDEDPGDEAAGPPEDDERTTEPSEEPTTTD